MLTATEHQQILTDALNGAIHGDAVRMHTAVSRLFAPGTDPRDGYVIACGALAVMLRDVPPPRAGGTFIPMVGRAAGNDAVIARDLDQAPPVVRTIARMSAAQANDDHDLSWALWEAVLSAGPRQVVEFIVSILMQAARTTPCTCGSR